MPGKRRKVLRFADVVWPMLFGEDAVPSRVLDGALPDDALAVGCSHDGRTTTIVFESATFDEVPDGEPCPEIIMVLRTCRDESEN